MDWFLYDNGLRHERGHTYMHHDTETLLKFTIFVFVYIYLVSMTSFFSFSYSFSI